jgi:hypothetical protein
MIYSAGIEVVDSWQGEEEASMAGDSPGIRQDSFIKAVAQLKGQRHRLHHHREIRCHPK